jgi:surfactin synthase thioesterase subunit
MEEAVEDLIDYLVSIQDAEPYLLRGYCNGDCVAYELARRPASRGIVSTCWQQWNRLALHKPIGSLG